MKINIAALMNLINEEEKKYSQISYNLKGYVFNTSVQELDGTVNVIEDNKEEFLRMMEELDNLSNRIARLKGILYDKNNEFRLKDGRSIQTAIVENSYLRKLKCSLEDILEYKSSKKRFTEVNNSYFEVREINFKREELMKRVSELDKKIQETDFEISKLNSKEFTI